jgi:uncharacterized protein
MRRLNRFAITLLTAYLVCSVLLGVQLAETALHPLRAPVTGAHSAQHWAETVHAQFENVEIAAADGVKLRAWHIRPQNSKGAVLLLHGVSDNREGVFGFAQFMVADGYSVLLPDSRVHGESGGAIGTYGVKERDDVHRWAEWLAKSESQRCVFGFAESMGAGILLQSIDGDRFCAVVAESGFAGFRDAAYDRIGDAMKLPLWAARTVMRPSIEIGLLYARLRYGVWLGRADPAEVVAHTRTPVFLIHGAADTNLRPRQSEMLKEADPQAVLWEVPGAGHCGAFAVAGTEFERRVLGWFDAHAVIASRERMNEKGPG